VKLRMLSACALILALAAIPAAPATAQVAQSGQVTLKVAVVITRLNGEKKTGSLPFLLMVVPSMTLNGPDGDRTSLQTGSEVPVPQTVFGPPATGGAASQPQTSYSYRSVGTNITGAARIVADGQFNVGLTVTDSQIMTDLPDTSAMTKGLPRFQSFTSTTRLLLRDGQSVQYTAATDKVSGDVIKLDVTMNVIK
jgi:hypothetical protein